MEYDNIDRLQQLRQLTRNIEPTTEQIPSTQVRLKKPAVFLVLANMLFVV